MEGRGWNLSNCFANTIHLFQLGFCNGSLASLLLFSFFYSFFYISVSLDSRRFQFQTTCTFLLTPAFPPPPTIIKTFPYVTRLPLSLSTFANPTFHPFSPVPLTFYLPSTTFPFHCRCAHILSLLHFLCLNPQLFAALLLACTPHLQPF